MTNLRSKHLDDIPKSILADFHQFMKKRLGIHLYKHQMEKFHKYINKALVKFNYDSAEDYLRYIENTDINSPEMEDFIAAVTVGESYFFRDENQINFLEKYYFPELIKRKIMEGDKRINVWSAGCCRGEEPYTIAMVLDRLLPDHAQWRINIQGTDINIRALMQAKQGRYKKTSMRKISDAFVNRYFDQADNYYNLKKTIADRVNFFYLNLKDNIYPSIANNTSAIDVLLCRNVLIYFDQDTIREITNRLASCVTLGGIIIFGSADNIMDCPKGVIKKKHNRIFYFMNEKIKEHKNVICKTETVNRKIVKPIRKPDKLVEKNKQIDKLENLINDEKWREALALNETLLYVTPDQEQLLQYIIYILLNTGNIKEAIRYCKKLLKISPCNSFAYLSEGLIYVELQKVDQAISMFKKCIYLSPELVEGHYFLAKSYLTKMNKVQGIKELRNTFNQLKKQDNNLKLYYMKNLDQARFKTMLEQEIYLYEAEQ